VNEALDPAFKSLPVWTPDSRRVVFSSDRAGGVMNLYSQAADGTGAVERLTESLNIQRASAVSPDGTVVFTETSPKTGEDVARFVKSWETETPVHYYGLNDCA
jgi:Tol biopolymer transport system component